MDKERPVKLYELEVIETKLNDIEKLIVEAGKEYATKKDLDLIDKDFTRKLALIESEFKNQQPAMQKTIDFHNKIFWTIASTVIVGVVVALSNLIKGGA